MSKIIFLHGTCSSGKTTLSKVLQSKIDLPFWHFASDQFVEVGMLPKRVNDGGPFDWSNNRPKFFKAFHRCIPAVLEAGNNIILEHIIESKEWFVELQGLFAPYDLFFVGLDCPIEILREREKRRSDSDIGNRYIGEAEYHLKHVHSYSDYDFMVETGVTPIDQQVDQVISAWHNRCQSKFFL